MRPRDTEKSNGQVVDFAQVREQKLEEKRRRYERILFQHLFSVYTVMGRSKLAPVELIDVSEAGCAFQIPYDPKAPWPTDADQSVPLRLYFTQDTYLEVLVRVQNSRPCITDKGRFTRYGCLVDTSTTSYPAYQQFVGFLKLYGETAHRDMGDMTVFYL